MELITKVFIHICIFIFVYTYFLCINVLKCKLIYIPIGESPPSLPAPILQNSMSLNISLFIYVKK